MPILHDSIQSEILAGVKLRSVPSKPTRDKLSEERSDLVEILSKAMDQRRTIFDPDSE